MERVALRPLLRWKTSRRFAAWFLLPFAAISRAAGGPPDDWCLARSPHFEVYSQAGDDADARAMALRLEQLRVLVHTHTGLDLDRRPPVRVLAFRSVSEYDPFRVAPSSDAYYLCSESRDYIVMAGLGPQRFAVAAHEYAHVALRASGVDLPLWLREGLAEVLSTVRISARGNTIGGDLPLRLQALQHERWLPLADLLSLTREHGLREGASIFYAESWALADLVSLSPAYAPRFPQFVTMLAGGATSQSAFDRVYGKSLDAVASDLQQRNARRSRVASHLAAPAPGSVEVSVSPVSDLRARLLIAEIVFLTGDLRRAESMYRALDRDAPNDPEVALGLGTLALRQGDPTAAREHWKRAIAAGTSDPLLCYRYASLANMAGVPADEIRPALLRAIELKPDFDDARYTLALLESNTGHHEAALRQLRAMRQIAPNRAFQYWTAMADSLTQLGDRAEAKAAARKAIAVAANESERRHAADLAHVAETDLAVRMTSDTSGQPHMVMTRIPHGASDFNPFVEPGDTMERAEGRLREVDCGPPVLRITVETESGVLKFAIPGLDRVQIRNGPGEFICGPQAGTRVTVDYAKARGEAETAGNVRGIEFK